MLCTPREQPLPLYMAFCSGMLCLVQKCLTYLEIICRYYKYSYNYINYDILVMNLLLHFLNFDLVVGWATGLF